MACHLCETRKPKRFCPAVRQEICSQCCGAEREQTLDCPLDCDYLIEARQHERLPAPDMAKMPHPDIRVTESFLEENRLLMMVFAEAMAETWLENPVAIDADLREALAALVKTYRTRDSGLIYDTRPANPYAEFIRQRVEQRVQQFREQSAQATGIHSVRDADVLGVMVFFERLAFQNDNGRRRGRAFIHGLVRSIADQRRAQGPPPEPGSLIVP